jgi:hypothetical protein
VSTEVDKEAVDVVTMEELSLSFVVCLRVTKRRFERVLREFFGDFFGDFFLPLFWLRIEEVRSMMWKCWSIKCGG